MKGARLIPSVCSLLAPDGEKALFEALRDDSDAANWVVLHSLDLAKHVAKVQGEADFVVIIPSQGVVVLEVKSHHNVKYDERGWWMGNDTTPDPRGPFKQASQAMHSIREYLINAGFPTGRIPFVSAVVFTSVSFDKKSPEWHSWQIIDLQALRARSISANILRVINEARNLYATKGLGWAAWTALPESESCGTMARLLRPRFEFLANPATALRELDDNLLRCTEQQFRFLDCASDNERLIVSGLAGTGKTTLAVEALRRERIANPKSSAALFCFNRLLGDKLRIECAFGLAPTKSGSFHQWMVEFADAKPSPVEAADPDYWSRRLPDRVLDLLTSAIGNTGILDFLVLDEAQDLFWDRYLDIFDLLLKGGLKSGHWFFFGDFERQNIFAQGSISIREFRERRATIGCANFHLDVNCRNTLEISNMMALLAQLSPSYSATLRGDSHHDPRLELYDTKESQIDLTTRALDQLLAAGFQPSDIVLLSPYVERSLANSLKECARWRTRLSEYPAGNGKINYCSVQAFKGLEAGAVILTDIDNLNTVGRLDLFYVGMSRALHRLHILAHQSTQETLRKALL
jgi:Nuclease-related domain/UvrD-like helicase C-terminal domain